MHIPLFCSCNVVQLLVFVRVNVAYLFVSAHVIQCRFLHLAVDKNVGFTYIPTSQIKQASSKQIVHFFLVTLKETLPKNYFGTSVASHREQDNP